MNKKRCFISIEGGEGSGKSTVICAIEQYLVSKGFEVLSTREPGGIKISEQIRDVILDKANTEMDGLTEAYLYAAARQQHVFEKIKPALDKNKIVICDRYIDSSFVYQGIARGLSVELIADINKPIIKDYMPNLTIILDMDPEKGLERIFKNNRNTNRLDLEGLEFHKKVRKGYQELASQFPERITLIHADAETDKVLSQVICTINNRLGL